MPAYFDHNATTPLDPRVLDAMQPFLAGAFGNASSAHRYGKAARAAIDTARQQIAAAVNAHPSEVLFTSGGTEANNWALRSAAQQFTTGTLAVSAIEHPAALEVALSLQGRDSEKTTSGKIISGRILDVDASGYVRSGQEGLGEHRLISVMWANNETGAVQPVARLARLNPQQLMHSDAVQAFGKVPINFRASGVAYMSLAAHKIYGPQGIGALIVDRKAPINPMLLGGGHEQGLRAGTENLAGIVGFGRAAELAQQNLADNTAYVQPLQQQLIDGLQALGLPIFTPLDGERLPNTVQFAVPGIEGETVQMLLDAKGFAVSSGSACATGKNVPSHVLAAMGVEPELALGAIRVSLSMNPHGPTANNADQIERFLAELAPFIPVAPVAPAA